ncbi:hypothetical protein AV274_1615 [Blastocystis sp. ATCC 50177/Nand II]|uniref:peptidylprolyl isomerase n=1 Tax=Blastocystis sp. subtype 1 (strain ATCC 50177 / NandII) TaxID=478820 RepID=A0A196SK28_BLAHN|nr:hypothetical protein AV274_1615 [Blastocystis sp. ATCC 50177/Nand II]
MFTRLVASTLLRSACRLQGVSTMRAFAHSFISADECVLKKGESYHVTDTGVRFIDLVEGEGEPCRKGDIIHIHHKGRVLNTGKPIPDNSYQIGVPLTLRIGVGMVMPAWDEGIPGMKVGGTRKIICTPDKAFGEKGTPTIPPFSTLIYEITLVAKGMDFLKGLDD